MPFPQVTKNKSLVTRFLLFFTVFLLISLLTWAQVNLKYRLLNGYLLTTEAPVNKGKPTLFVFEEPERFEQVFKASSAAKRADAPNFNREMVIGVALPSTNKPPKLSVSRVFVNDSTLTVRYIRMVDTTLNKNPLPTSTQPTLVVAVPKQTVLKTRIIENGKLVQTIQKRETE